MVSGQRDPGRSEREAARLERERLEPHRRASWAAGSVGAANGCVLSFAAFATLAIGAAWGIEAVQGDATPVVTVVYGASLLALAVAVGVLWIGSERVSGGALADGQGTHLGLLLGAGGALLVTVVIAGFGIARDYFEKGNWSMPCVCFGTWPLLVSAWNVIVLVRHGESLRRDDIAGRGDL